MDLPAKLARVLKPPNQTDSTMHSFSGPYKGANIMVLLQSISNEFKEDDRKMRNRSYFRFPVNVEKWVETNSLL